MNRNAPLRTALLLALACSQLPAQDTNRPERRRTPDPEKVHDPSTIVENDGVFRSLSTGMGIAILREQEDGRWLAAGSVFDLEALPAWHREMVPGNRGHLWAPDLIRLKDRYFVYYSVSTFGKNTSAIGLAVGKTLDPKSPDWGWEDRGPVLTSGPADRYNAIDPALFQDDDQRLYMTYGSFWDGIHLVELDPVSGQRLENDPPPRQLAYAPEIEAPFLCKGAKGGYFLFVNWGRCCRGLNSTYEIRVGRSEKPTGPFLDRDGKDLRKQGGTLLLATRDRFIGPGHPSLLERGGKTWLVHHFYDGENRGRSRLRLLPLTWDEDGWPTIAPEPEEMPEEGDS